MRTVVYSPHPAIHVYLARVSEDPFNRANLPYHYTGPIEYLQQLPSNESYIILDPKTLNPNRDEDMEFDLWLDGRCGIEVRWAKDDLISGCQISIHPYKDTIGLYVYPPLTKEEFVVRFDLPAPGYFLIPA